MTHDSEPFFEGIFIDVVGLVAIGLLLVLTYFASKRIDRSRGRDSKFHTLYAACVILSILLIPLTAKEVLFNPLNVAVAGTVYPIYESLRAICTVGSEDDKLWLTYWISHGLISFTTEWMDRFMYWNMIELFLFLWLFLPWTDGATLVFDFIVAPLVAPNIQPLVKKMDGFVQKLVMAVMNAGYLSFVWIAFVFLDPGEKYRFESRKTRTGGMIIHT